MFPPSQRVKVVHPFYSTEIRRAPSIGSIYRHRDSRHVTTRYTMHGGICVSQVSFEIQIWHRSSYEEWYRQAGKVSECWRLANYLFWTNSANYRLKKSRLTLSFTHLLTGTLSSATQLVTAINSCLSVGRSRKVSTTSWGLNSAKTIKNWRFKNKFTAFPWVIFRPPYG